MCPAPRAGVYPPSDLALNKQTNLKKQRFERGPLTRAPFETLRSTYKTLQYTKLSQTNAYNALNYASTANFDTQNLAAKSVQPNC